MKKSTIFLLIAFVVLAGTVWYLNQAKSDTSLSSNDWHFAVKDSDKIAHIFLANKNGQQIDLKKKNGKWKLNDKYAPNANSIKNMLHTLSRVTLKYRPPEGSKPNIVKEIATNGIKVELYDDAENRLKTYYLGSSTNDERGNYMIMEGSDNPYVMHVPTFEGNLRMRFFLDEEKWRDKTVFSEDTDNIASVSIHYPKQPQNSFILNVKDKKYTVLPLSDGTHKITKHPLKNGAVSVFLDAFSNQIAEAFDTNSKDRTEITSKTPFCEIKVIRKDGSSKEVRLFPILDGKSLDKDGNELGDIVIEKYNAETSDGDFFIVQNALFKKMLWAYDYFYSE